MQKDAEKLEKAGIQVVGISYDKVAVLKKFADERKVTFPLLSDDGSKVIKEYGLHFMRGLPHPGTLLIDKKGNIQARLFEKGYRTRHATDALIKAAEKLKSEG